MPMVWMRDDPERRTRFHRVPDCRQLRKAQSRGVQAPLITVDLDEIGVRPCATCYPDAPRVSILKAYCWTCESRYACEHNGGVEVIERRGHRRWLWPDTNQMPFYRSST